jgi:hypothetical protein
VETNANEASGTITIYVDRREVVLPMRPDVVHNIDEAVVLVGVVTDGGSRMCKDAPFCGHHQTSQPTGTTMTHTDDFDLWLEFEHWGDREDDYCNIQIVHSGQKYALNVWTFEFASQVEKEVMEESNGPPYFTEGPDLLVQKLTRPELESVARALIVRGLSKAWLVEDED